MTSSDPNIARLLPDGFVPRAPYVGPDPRPLFQGLNAGNDLRSQLYEMRFNGRRFIAFLSILLGDDEVLDEGVTGNKPHGGELTYPTNILWLPEKFKNKSITRLFRSGEHFLEHMGIALREVLKFGARATDVAKAFARTELYLVQHVLFKVEDLRVALHALVKLMDSKRPLMDPLVPDIIPSDGFVPSASYILEPLPRSDPADLELQLRGLFHNSKQFYIFVSILLGEDESDATVRDRGGALSVTDHDSLEPHGAPKITIWLPEYLKRRDAIPGFSGTHCWTLLMGPFREVMKFGARTTAVAKTFARMKIENVEYLLVNPEVMRRTFQQFAVNNAEDENTRD